MKVHIDEEADALYLRLDESKIIESESTLLLNLALFAVNRE
jgi:uncharacterized protein YuzE